MPVLRLKHLLGVLERHPEHQARVAGLLRRLWSEVDNAALLADFAFAPRMAAGLRGSAADCQTLPYHVS